ncbi:MazG-like family protein [Patescibacteria group bacterium]
MGDLQKITNQIISFREERDWSQFHTPKEIAISIAIEAAELMEKFQWSRGAEMEYIEKRKNEIGEELADVMIYLLMLAYSLNIDMERAIKNKIKKNCIKYPIEKIKGKDIKHTEL